MTVEYIESPLLGQFRHGFFARMGGVSTGSFESLNCGLSTTDDPAAVCRNRAIASEAIGIDPNALTTVKQVHSANAIAVDRAASLSSRAADGMATSTPGLALGILTADCQPVLLGDPETGIVGAAHAGWRGALSGIIESTIRAMVELGAHRKSIRAAVGPAISQPNYEVGPEFHQAFLDGDPDHSAFFEDGAGDRKQFDLPGFGLAALERAGVGASEWTGHCTYDDPARFFSCRRSHHESCATFGVMVSIIAAG